MKGARVAFDWFFNFFGFLTAEIPVVALVCLAMKSFAAAMVGKTSSWFPSFKIINSDPQGTAAHFPSFVTYPGQYVTGSKSVLFSIQRKVAVAVRILAFGY